MMLNAFFLAILLLLFRMCYRMCFRLFVLQSRVDSLKDINLSQEDDVKALRLKIQQVEMDYSASRNELDDVRYVYFSYGQSINVLVPINH